MTNVSHATVTEAHNRYWLWLLPVFALILIVYIVWRNLPPQGETVLLHFSNASGIESKQTKVQYRGLSVGKVSQIGLTDDAKQVEVRISLNKMVMPLINQRT